MSVIYTPSQFTKMARTLFMDASRMQPPNYIERIATFVSSTAASEDYVWVGETQQMGELTSEVEFTGLTDASYSLSNKTYTAGLQVKRTDLTNNQTGGIQMRIRQMAEVAARLPNKLLTDALINGTSATLGKTIDGVALFHATHPARGLSGTQSNLLTGTGTTTAALQLDIGAAVMALFKFKGENGEPVNEGFQRFWIMYPTDAALHKSITEALNSSLVSNTSNVSLQQFGFDLIPNSRLVDQNDWYMGVQDVEVRGLVWQQRQPLTFESQESEASDSAFVREVYRYKAREECAPGYAKWQRVVKTTNT